MCGEVSLTFRTYRFGGGAARGREEDDGKGGRRTKGKLGYFNKGERGAIGGRKKEGRTREGGWRGEEGERIIFSNHCVSDKKQTHGKGAAGVCMACLRRIRIEGPR